MQDDEYSNKVIMLLSRNTNYTDFRFQLNQFRIT